MEAGTTLKKWVKLQKGRFHIDETRNFLIAVDNKTGNLTENVKTKMKMLKQSKNVKNQLFSGM